MAFRANTEVDVSPYTVPLATATPSGPGPLFSGTLARYSHISLPVASASVYTLASSSCMYTTPPCTTGPAVNAPTPGTPAAAVPDSLNAHASRSVDTFADEMTEPGASRVLARLPLGYGHCPEGDAVGGRLVATGAALALPAPGTAISMVSDAKRAAERQTHPSIGPRLVSLGSARSREESGTSGTSGLAIGHHGFPFPDLAHTKVISLSVHINVISL